jgi:hypothetical protein
MLRRYIHSREQHFHRSDSRRTSLPFDYGTEFLGVTAGPGESPLAALHGFSQRMLATSDNFFDYLRTDEYSLQGEILRFPSAIETDYPENNTVWGRFFPAARPVALIVLPQWNCSWEGHVGLCRLLQRAGFASLRLSLPYHHFRKPAHLQRPEYMVSANLGQTLQATQQAVLDARRAADWLLAQGYSRIGILGSSLGSCVAFLTFTHDTRFSAGIFIHVAGYFAEVVWHGLSTTHVRKSLEGHVGIEQLRHIWAPISPLPYIHRLKHTDRRILMFSGRYDPTFLPRLSQQAFNEFDRCEVPYQLRWLSCGHYTMAQFPFNALVVKDVIRFLKREADRT